MMDHVGVGVDVTDVTCHNDVLLAVRYGDRVHFQ